MSSTLVADDPTEGVSEGGHERARNGSSWHSPPVRAPTHRARGTTATRTLGVYYRLRCLALEATVDSLETQLRRTERQLDDVVARYEELLEERDGQRGRASDGRDSVVFTTTGR